MLKSQVLRLGDSVELELNEQDKKHVEELWAKVFESSNRVISQNQKYGFQGVAKLPHPDVHVMVVQLKYFGAIIDILIDQMPHDEMRLLLNAKAQIANMELLALAVSTNNLDAYRSALEALERQAVF